MNDVYLPSLPWEKQKTYRAAIRAGFFDDFEKNVRKWKHSFHGAYIWKHPGRTKTLCTFRSMLGHMPTWEDITDENLKDLLDELTDGGMAPSSLHTICSELKALINENYEQHPKSVNFKRILSPKKGSASQAVYLTRDEMMRFINFHPVGENETFVHRIFSISMMTGARRVDAERLTMANCDYETNMLSYVPQKTPGIVVTVPVDERMPLRRFLANDFTPGHTCCQDTFNENVRSICKQIGLNTLQTIRKREEYVTEEKWKLCTSHTARRSFATNLYLAGVGLEDIALLMGHGLNIDTTKRYICAERQLSRSVVNYFQPQEIIKYEPTEP